MGSVQIAGVVVTANAIGVVALVGLLYLFDVGGTRERTAGRGGRFRPAQLLVPVVASLGVSLLLSLVYLYVAAFGPVVGAVPMEALLAGTLATLFVGLFGPVAVLLGDRLWRHQRVDSVPEDDRGLDRMFRNYDAGDGDSRDDPL